MPSTSDLRLILAAGALVALAAFVVQWEESGRLNADLTLERARADSLFLAYRDARSQVDGTRTMSQQRERDLQRHLARAQLRLRAVRREIPPSAPPETVRVIATEALATLDTLRGVVDTLSALTDSLSGELRLERWRTQQALDAADASIAARDALIRALEAPQKPCRVLGLPCPTRTQSVAAGAILALVAVVAR